MTKDRKKGQFNGGKADFQIGKYLEFDDFSNLPSKTGEARPKIDQTSKLAAYGIFIKLKIQKRFRCAQQKPPH